MNVERKLKAYVDKVEQKYEDFSVKDTLKGYKKDMMHALNEIDRSRSRSPKNDRSDVVRSKTSDHSSDDESLGSAARAPQFRKSMSHQAAPSDAMKAKEQTIKKKLMSGMKGFFKFSKTKEEEAEQMINRGKPNRIPGRAQVTGQGRQMTELRQQPHDRLNPINSGEKKLPKNFANKVLDYELKIDSGRFDIETIDKLMQLYSQAVEYYSGQNDEKYMYFTERIQNTLLRPEILRLMKEQNNSNEKQREEHEKERKVQQEKEQKMTHNERMKLRQLEHEQRKKARVDKLHESAATEVLLDPESKKDREIIKNEKLKTEKTIQLLKNDQMSQVNSIQSRIAERKKRLQMKRSAIMVQGDLDATVPTHEVRRKKNRGAPISVRNSHQLDQRGFIPLITQEELERDGDGLNGGDSTLDDVEVNHNFLSPNISGINSNNTSGMSPYRKANRSRKHNLSEDMNDLSAIQKANNGDSLNQTNLELIRKLQTRNNGQASDLSESDTSINKLGPAPSESAKLDSKPSIQEEEQSDVNFKLETFDLQSTNSHIFNEEELQQYEEHIQQKINEVWTSIQQKQDQIQNDFQNKLEQIIEDCAQMKFEKIAEVKFMYKKEEDPEKLAERDREIDQIKSDMETLKTQRVLEAKQKMQEEKRKISEEKNRLLEDAKNRFVQSRPGGGGDSVVGENFIDFMNSSPQSLKIAKSRAGGSTSMRTSPKGSNTSPLLKVQEMLKLQSQDSEVQQNTTNLLKGVEIAINQQTLKGKIKCQSPIASSDGAGKLTQKDIDGEIDIDIADIEC